MPVRELSRSIRLQKEANIWRVSFASANNTIGADLVEQLLELLGEHGREEAGHVLVLTGSGDRFFSPGLDLREIGSLDRTELRGFMDRFESLYLRLHRHPRPTLALLNGDALAGGWLLAACCDCRLAREDCRVGMTPLNRVVPLPDPAIQILKSRLGVGLLSQALYLGRNFSAPEAASRGWIHRLAPASGLEEEARRLASTLALQSARSFAVMKDSLWPSPRLEGREAARERFLDCWFGPDAQERIRSLLERIQQD